MLSLEGQDASGKTTLLHHLADALRARGYETHTVPEFSSSDVGSLLTATLQRDRFLRWNLAVSTALAETLLLATDLYCKQSVAIEPAAARGAIVLVERHIDSIFACQIPKIAVDFPSYHFSYWFRWLADVLAMCNPPDCTVLLRTSRSTMIQRLQERGETVDEDELRVFDDRDCIYQWLATTYPERITEAINEGAITDVARELTDLIDGRLSAARL